MTTTKRDRAAAAAFFNDQPEWDLVIAHWIETGEKRYGAGTVRANVLALAEAFAAHAAGEADEVGIQLVALKTRLRLATQTIEEARCFADWYGDGDDSDAELSLWRDALAAWDDVPGDDLAEDLDDVPPRC